MVPSVAKSGHSFKGALAYYLHDKGGAGDARAQTAERVAWTEVRNLVTDDPEAAKRIMIATAQQADELKARAGIKATGRKSNAHVYAYSLAWHPDEAGQLDRTEMLRAVDQSLKILGAQEHQALIVCHTDQKHPHVHVVVNRVHPTTGKMLSTSNDRFKLSDWANEYERGRGQILTPKREEKRELREQFAEKTARQEFAQEKRAEATARPKADKSKAAMLKEFGEAQKVDHGQQWRDLSEKNKAARTAIYDTYAERIRTAQERHKAECKPIWASYFKQARAEERAFAVNEKSLTGVVANAIKATAHQKETGQLGPRGVLSATFGNVLSSQARAAAFGQRQELNRQQMAGQLKTVLDQEIAGLKDRRAKALSAQRTAYDTARAALIEKQDLERGKIREAWRQIYTDRGKDAGARSRTYRERIERKNQWQGERTATKEHRAEQTPRPIYRRDVSMTAEQTRKGIERKEALRPQPSKLPPAQENPVRDAFNKHLPIANQPTPKPAPAQAAFVSRPAPAPAPAGETPRPPAKALQNVPVKPTPAPVQAKPLPAVRKDWQGGKPAPATPAPDPRRDMGAAAKAPPTPAPAKTTPAPVTPAPEARKDWSAATQAPRQFKTLPPRDPTKGRDRDR